MRIPFFRPIKFLVAIGLMLFAGLQKSRAQGVQSPRGADVFGQSTISVILPPAKKVRVSWSFPVNRETPDLIFKLYHSNTLLRPLRNWNLLTNIPGTLRNVDLPAVKAAEFFVMTASNYLGESGFSMR